MTELEDLHGELYDTPGLGFEAAYSRDGSTWSGMQVVKGRQATDRVGQTEQSYLTEETDDFVVLASHFRDLTGLLEPVRLDRITANGKTYSVGVDGVEDAYRDVNGLGVMWRIHAQAVG